LTSEPLSLALRCRTATYIGFKWELPAAWGGCALSQYEVELREKTIHGEFKEWASIYRGDARKCEGGAHVSVYAGEARVRAYNVAESTPSHWSEVLVVATDKEEDALAKIQAAYRGKKDRRKAEAVKEQAKETATAAEQNVAVVTTDVEYGTVKNRQGSVRELHRQKTIMTGWSPFKTAVGAMFVEMGVKGGVEGMLFDVSVEQVEQLLLGNATEVEGIDEDKPLMTLASAGVWVLETLAHYAQDSDEWILFMNDIDGLVRLAAQSKSIMGADGRADAAVKQMLYTLHEIYESLRQCEEGGYVHLQLSYKYDKALRKQLKADWEGRLAELKEKMATSVMTIVLLERGAFRGQAESLGLDMQSAQAEAEAASERAIDAIQAHALLTRKYR